MVCNSSGRGGGVAAGTGSGADDASVESPPAVTMLVGRTTKTNAREATRGGDGEEEAVASRRSCTPRPETAPASRRRSMSGAPKAPSILPRYGGVG
jgi:hypothetical protein